MAVIKYVVICLLVIHSSCMVLLLRYTQMVPTSPKYLSSTVVLLGECIKLLTSLFIIYYQNKFQWCTFYHELYRGLFATPLQTLQIAIPAGIYAFQNNLLFIALNYLDAATYQVTYQLKILTTAICSVLLLKSTISRQQWFSLVLLTVGVGLIQFPSKSLEESHTTWSNQLIGVGVLLIATLSSGFSGVYFEMLLKQSYLPVWIANVQMAAFGIIFALITTLCSDWDKLSRGGLFQGYNMAVVAVLLLQAYGGLLVGFTVRYTNTIVKGFATSLSIILSTFISSFIFEDLHLSSLFILGTTITLFATFLYGWNPPPTEKSKME